MFYRLRFMFRVVYYVLFTGMSSKTSILLESFKFIEMVPYRHEQSSFDLIFKGQETVGTLYHTIDEIYPLIVPLQTVNLVLNRNRFFFFFSLCTEAFLHIGDRVSLFLDFPTFEYLEASEPVIIEIISLIQMN